MALPPPIRLTVAERVRGLAALGAARLVLARTRSRPDSLERALRGYAAGARPAGLPEAERAWKVIITISPRCGGDTQCLIRSVAVALYCRAGGTWPTWRTGMRYPPMQSHAWVEAGGRPVGEDARNIATYTPAFSVAAESTSNTNGA
ncbi:lasso peptide biosynthesis B2 protein [Bailinhaonella thermotolerans]|uniref:Lasso peptide biosynthesis B2 protein n=2 Tax=Bailinhaonella thermotolerans TaxID=1070861 RepID=A0A3A4AX84_9ACTN|nr:lasso peptide biosynthesis B2 protein [Bailinhaonella thermotolerans]